MFASQSQTCYLRGWFRKLNRLVTKIVILVPIQITRFRDDVYLTGFAFGGQISMLLRLDQ
jgi:hypothetical protein